jgi:hypothetical protein
MFSDLTYFSSLLNNLYSFIAQVTPVAFQNIDWRYCEYPLILRFIL